MASKKPIVITAGQMEVLQPADFLQGVFQTGNGAPTGGADGDIYIQLDASPTTGGDASMTDAFVASMFLRG